MKIASTDDWMEHLALKVAAMEMALRVGITANPQWQAETAAAAEQSKDALLATRFSDDQIRRLLEMLKLLGTPL